MVTWTPSRRLRTASVAIMSSASSPGLYGKAKNSHESYDGLLLKTHGWLQLADSPLCRGRRCLLPRRQSD